MLITIARVVNNESGYPVIDKEIDFFDKLTTGKGEDNPDQFTIVEFKVPETAPGSGIPDLSMSDCFDWVDRQDHQDGIPQWHDNGMPVMDPHRIPKKKYDTKELKKASHRRIPSVLLNKANASALKEVFVADYEADFEKERAKYDTLANLILTVGTGKTFATISAAFSASSSADSVFIFATALGFYSENPVIPHSLTVAGMIVNQGVIVQSSTGNVFTGTTGTNIILNLTVRGVGGTPTLGFFMSGVGGILGACTVFDVQFGLRINSGTLCVNCLGYDCTDSGLFTTSGTAKVLFVTTANNTKNGISVGTGTSVDFCLSISNTTADYINGLATASMGNVSSDATQPGTGGVGNATTSVFTNFAAKDFSLNIANAITVFAVPGVATDITGGARRTTDTSNVVYPGAFDPNLAVTVAPAAPVITLVAEGNAQVTIGVTGDLLVTHNLFFRKSGTALFSTGLTRVGDGNIVQTGLDNNNWYQFFVQSSTSGNFSVASNFVGGLPTDGSNTPTGGISGPLDLLALTIAKSTTFQSMTTALNETEALDFIFIFEKTGSLKPTFAVIDWWDNWERITIAGGERNFFSQSGDLRMFFRGPISGANVKEEGYNFANKIDKIIKEMEVFTGTGGFLDVNSFSMVETPGRPHPDNIEAAKGPDDVIIGDYYDIVFRVRYLGAV